MRKIPAAVLVIASCFSCASVSGDDKKEMIVETGRTAQQVNNHPWSYSTAGNANTNCTGTGTVNGTATDLGYGTSSVQGTVNTDTNCNTTYNPPKTYSGNRVTVDNAAWVTDTATGDQYLIQCTAGWAGSKCSQLLGGKYKAELRGNNMWITGMRGMKASTAKYHVLRYVPVRNSASTANVSSSSGLTEDERFTWNWYNNLSDIDKKYVNEFCPSNPSDKALLPRVKVEAGEPAERALYCQPWLSAKAKQ